MMLENQQLTKSILCPGPEYYLFIRKILRYLRYEIFVMIKPQYDGTNNREPFFDFRI